MIDAEARRELREMERRWVDYLSAPSLGISDCRRELLEFLARHSGGEAAESEKLGTLGSGALGRENQVLGLVMQALWTDGGHHKQWYLHEIAKVIGLKDGTSDPGVAP